MRTLGRGSEGARSHVGSEETLRHPGRGIKWSVGSAGRRRCGSVSPFLQSQVRNGGREKTGDRDLGMARQRGTSQQQNWKAVG